MKNISKKIGYTLMIIMFFVIANWSISAVNSNAEVKNNKIIFNKGWSYYWIESKTDSHNNSNFINKSNNGINWIKIDDLSTGIKNPDKRSDFLLKVTLPVGNWEAPCIFFNKMKAQGIEVYQNNKEIYKKTDDFSHNNGYTLALPLQKNDMGKELIIKINIDKSVAVAGPVGNVIIGNYNELIYMTVKNGFPDLALGSALAIAAIIMLIGSIFLKGTPRTNWVILSLTVFFIGVMVATFISNLSSLYPEYSLVFVYISGFSIYATFIFLMLFFKRILGNGYRNYLNKFLILQIIFSAAAFLVRCINDIYDNKFGALTNLISIQLTSVLLIAVLIILLARTIYYSFKGNVEAKIFALGFLAFALSIILDLVLYLHTNVLAFTYWKWGILIFVISLVSIMGRQFAMDHKNALAYQHELEEKNNKLSELWKEVAASRDEIAKWNKELEKLVAERTASIANLLNNAGQGFLYFSKDQLIKPEHSTACNEIFGYEISGNNITNILYPNDENQRSLVAKTFSFIINEADEYRRDVYISAMPNEFVINNRVIKGEYRVIEDKNNSENSIMMILTDITENRNIENQMEQERKILKMVVNIVVNYDEFMNCVDEYKDLCQCGIRRIIELCDSFTAAYSEIYRQIHTFKGIFSQFGMINIVDQLHKLETSLTELKYDNLQMSEQEFENMLLSKKLEKWIDEDLKILANVLGEEFFNKTTKLEIDDSKLTDIENKMVSLLSYDECKELLPYIRKLRYKSLKELLRLYPEYLDNLSLYLGKRINSFKIEGEDIEVDPSKYRDIIKSLVHVFRNMIDHGIEEVEHRVEAGKEECGNINCKVYSENNGVVISISDDGAGISEEVIRNKIIEMGIHDQETINKMSSEEVIMTIFDEGFSTKKDVTDVSGRGIGLSAVKNELNKIGGTIQVITKYGKGTEFRFSIPDNDDIELSIKNETNMEAEKAKVETRIENLEREIEAIDQVAADLSLK